ncbi:hypothetical protein BI364_13035 [Acidihalobacter yilgarnensis]|uniref:Alkyl hydroperoxide reductase subunit C/ Thiol specific antioxidant domain-containing protein n=1 Tax=Acidihalobacter yilgarnensis TaxID=2819280 RepID=A0A1D8IQS0_9GAMM|nr:hypothetical protein [Acidihalobacter yilgarnensis]AOU98767.1 hypothetical protein BI364_13035 [Acidihalobacter yilgarnensis]
MKRHLDLPDLDHQLTELCEATGTITLRNPAPQAAQCEVDALDRSARATVVGDTASDFALPDANGSLVTPAGLRPKESLVLIFYWSNWLPCCDLELRTQV